MPETLCPSCGHSPIPDGAEECPRCHEAFAVMPHYRIAQRKMNVDPSEVSRTAMRSVVTGMLTAHPQQATAAFALAALVWFVRAGGVVQELGEPRWSYTPVALCLVSAMLLGINVGPARLVAQLSVLTQVGAALWLSNGYFDVARSWAFPVFGAAQSLLVFGQPRTLRRHAGLGLVVLLGLVCLVSLWPKDPRRSISRLVLDSPTLRYRLVLPPSFVALSKEELSARWHVPADSTSEHFVGFGDPAHEVFGVLWIDEGSNPQLIGGCQELLHRLGAQGEAMPMAHPPPAAFGEQALGYQFRTRGGALGALACGKTGSGRLLGLALVSDGRTDVVPLLDRAAVGLQVP